MCSPNTSPFVSRCRCWQRISGTHLTVSPLPAPGRASQQKFASFVCFPSIPLHTPFKFPLLLTTSKHHLSIPTLPSIHRNLTTMPFLRAEAPPHVPDEETIEYLLGEENKSSKRTAKISPLQDLEPDVRQRTGLITLGKLQKRIQGDPWGYYFSWAGNVSHPDDRRVVSYFRISANNMC